MTFAAGIDVGNSTTEVVLGRLSATGVELLGTARAPTRRAKGSPQSLDGATALVRRLEREHGVRIDRAAVARLRPVETLTASLPEPRAATGRLAILGAGARTAGGQGFAVGRPYLLDGRTAPPRDGGGLVAVVPAGMGYREAHERLDRLIAAGRLVAVVLQDDEAVLISNRLGAELPVVDEIDAGAALRAQLLAVEVAGPGGSTLRALTDPLRLATAFALTEEDQADVARLARQLHDSRNAVVALHHQAPGQEQSNNRPTAWVDLAPAAGSNGGHGRETTPFARAHELIAAGPIGLAQAYALPPDQRRHLVDDLWTVDLAAIADAVLARRTGSRAIGVATLRADAPLTDPSLLLTERLGVPVIVGDETRAAWAGALSTPGAESAGPAGSAESAESARSTWSAGSTGSRRSATVVLDLGGGTIDAVSASSAVVAAGGGELLTASVAALAGTTSAAAEWVKRGPAHRVEAPQLLLGEDGERSFLDRPAPAETIGSLVVRGPAGLLAFNRTLAPGEWRALRLRLKVQALGGNVLRALRTLDLEGSESAGSAGSAAVAGSTGVGGKAGNAALRTVIVLGGPAGDEEVLAALAHSLPDGVAISRGNVGGTLGHRYAVAYGLLSLLAERNALS